VGPARMIAESLTPKPGIREQSPQSRVLSICNVELGARQAVGGRLFLQMTDDRYKRSEGAVSRGEQRAEPAARIASVLKSAKRSRRRS